MEQATLYYLLTVTSKRVHEAYTKSRGKRGGRGNDFHLGYASAVDDIIKAINKNDPCIIENAFWEVRGYKVDKHGERLP